MCFLSLLNGMNKRVHKGWSNLNNFASKLICRPLILTKKASIRILKQQLSIQALFLGKDIGPILIPILPIANGKAGKFPRCRLKLNHLPIIKDDGIKAIINAITGVKM
jgi:hypothetical protein